MFFDPREHCRASAMDDVLADMQADLLKEISAEGHGLEPQPTAAIATATKRITSKDHYECKHGARGTPCPSPNPAEMCEKCQLGQGADGYDKAQCTDRQWCTCCCTCDYTREDVEMYYGEVGHWESAEAATLADQLLASSEPLISRLNEEELSQVVRSVTGPPPPPCARGGFAKHAGLLSRDQCEILLHFADTSLHRITAGLSSEESGPLHIDMKLGLSYEKLAELVGAAGAESLCACVPPLLGSNTPRPNFILRRRATNTGDERIAFHRDRALSVVSVALNDDFDGGKVVFIAPGDGAVSCPVRLAGDATVHDAATIHGVTRLEAGVRYVLIAICYADSRDWLHQLSMGTVLTLDYDASGNAPSCGQHSKLDPHGFRRDGPGELSQMAQRPRQL